MSTLVRRFGAAVREFREARAWSQEQLAEHAGLNRSYVGEIERGCVIASIVTVDKLACALNVPISSLLHSSRGSTVSAIPVSPTVSPTASPPIPQSNTLNTSN